MTLSPKNLVGLGRKAVSAGLGIVGRLRGGERDATVPPPRAANGAAATPTAGPVPTGRSTPRRKAAAKRTAAKKKPAAAKKKPAARKPAAKKKAASKEPSATANGAGATDKPGSVPTGQTATSETPGSRSS